MSRSKIPAHIQQRVAEVAQYRCGYCLSPQQYVMERLQIEHIFPKFLGGSDDESNLWLACGFCNRYKGVQINGIDPITHELVPLFNPRLQNWSKHFRWSEKGARILGLTSIGHATVVALQLNNDLAVIVRKHWVSAGWHPPQL